MKKTTILTLTLLLQGFSCSAEACDNLVDSSSEKEKALASRVLQHEISLAELNALHPQIKSNVNNYVKDMRASPDISQNDLLTNQAFNTPLPVRQVSKGFAEGHILIDGLNYKIKAISFLVNGATAHSVNDFLKDRFYPLKASLAAPTFENKLVDGAANLNPGECMYFSVDPSYGYFYLVLEKPGIQEE